jgi:hypothetical protein
MQRSVVILLGVIKAGDVTARRFPARLVIERLAIGRIDDQRAARLPLTIVSDVASGSQAQGQRVVAFGAGEISTTSSLAPASVRSVTPAGRSTRVNHWLDQMP